MSIWRWWLSAFIVGVAAVATWSTLRSPQPVLSLGVALVVAVQSAPLVLAAGIGAWLLDALLVYLLEPSKLGKLTVATLSGCIVAGLVVTWAQPEASLILTGMVAGGTGGLVSQVDSWFERNGWATVLGGTGLAVGLGLLL
jgi:hypothetical protein